MPAKCKKETVDFVTKRGKTVTFRGRHGTNCPPRVITKEQAKKMTKHLKPYKEVFAEASEHCARRHKPGRGPTGRAFRKCVGQAVHSVKG
jgi:hypothetical protein